jgi:hypothetical protein
MADGTAKTERAPAGSGARTPRFTAILSPEDPKRLRLIRESRKNGPLQAMINEANTIHTPALRDAALGHILKHRIKYILQAPVLMNMNELPYQQNELRLFVPMISDPVKREQMTARIAAIPEEIKSKEKRSKD